MEDEDELLLECIGVIKALEGKSKVQKEIIDMQDELIGKQERILRENNLY